MDKPINESWLQFATIKAKGNVNKTALKFPFHTRLEVDKEYLFSLAGRDYIFTCVAEETKTTNGEGVDKVYVVATTHA